MVAETFFHLHERGNTSVCVCREDSWCTKVELKQWQELLIRSLIQTCTRAHTHTRASIQERQNGFHLNKKQSMKQYWQQKHDIFDINNNTYNTAIIFIFIYKKNNSSPDTVTLMFLNKTKGNNKKLAGKGKYNSLMADLTFDTSGQVNVTPDM